VCGRFGKRVFAGVRSHRIALAGASGLTHARSMAEHSHLGGRIGLALGSGAARGWAHVGVIRGLLEAGIVPEVVVGSSSGALVGAMYAAGRLDVFEAWGRSLDWRQVFGYFDLTFRGGLIKATRLLDELAENLPVQEIEALPRPFACVATDLSSGREVWLRRGPLLDAIRASFAVPGLIAPVRIDERWLIDGGVANPVPVSLCRAMGADTVIAVDLNTTLLGRRLRGASHPALEAGAPSEAPDATEGDEGAPPPADSVATGTLRTALDALVADLRRRVNPSAPADRETKPSIYEVLAQSLNIMQVRITRGRMAGDPPELLVTPRLGDFGLLDFDRAREAITEGERAVARALDSGG
jgi:NTE family protein